jgi:antitoxin Phd
MRKDSTKAAKQTGGGARSSRSKRIWKMQDAKAQFSLVVRCARETGPQRVTYRGKDAVVVVAAEEYDRLTPRPKARPSLFTLMQRSPLRDLDFDRRSVRSPVRDPEF